MKNIANAVDWLLYLILALISSMKMCGFSPTPPNSDHTFLDQLCMKLTRSSAHHIAASTTFFSLHTQIFDTDGEDWDPGD